MPFTKQSTKSKLNAAQGYHESAREPQPEQDLLKSAACQDEPGLLFFARELLSHSSQAQTLNLEPHPRSTV